MRKTAIFLTSIFILTSTSIIIFSNYSTTSESNTDKAPDWIHKIKQKNDDTKIRIGYDQYFLINKIDDKNKDPFQQKDWINLDLNQDLYLYLPQANNIEDAVKNISIDDSAKTSTIEIETPFTWKKVDDTTYTNNTIITEDTTVSGIALIDNNKFVEIKKSNITNTWTNTEKDFFDKYASFPPGIKDPNKGQNQNWWNANGWEKLLTNSQLDIYNKWINQKIIGMNVTLSLLAENSFMLQTTEINHVFRFQAMPQQLWINNDGNIKTILTPHWGFTLLIKDNQGKKIFQTPQLMHVKNAYKENEIINYLLKKAYFSFNSQETTKFKENKII